MNSFVHYNYNQSIIIIFQRLGSSVFQNGMTGAVHSIVALNVCLCLCIVHHTHTHTPHWSTLPRQNLYTHTNVSTSMLTSASMCCVANNTQAPNIRWAPQSKWLLQSFHSEIRWSLDTGILLLVDYNMSACVCVLFKLREPGFAFPFHLLGLHTLANEKHRWSTFQCV